MFQKIFNGYIFYFLGQLFGGQLFELFARETNLKKQSSVPLIEILLTYLLKYGGGGDRPLSPHPPVPTAMDT